MIASHLRNPDFAAYARAFGGHGETVEETAEFLPAFERALASGAPSIIHVKIDPEAITPATTLGAIRAAALARTRGSVRATGSEGARMNVDEALRRFAEGEDFPREAMAWALANWETASPRFIARLRAFAAGGDRTEAAEDQLFYHPPSLRPDARGSGL